MSETDISLDRAPRADDIQSALRRLGYGDDIVSSVSVDSGDPRGPLQNRWVSLSAGGESVRVTDDLDASTWESTTESVLDKFRDARPVPSGLSAGMVAAAVAAVVGVAAVVFGGG
ncbi:hypothetical protein [Haloferax marisrubri]|uniref:Uncharacterized protein n=1 Tax=Haloferax marisrubri TaxID=1544719 RepID=A0A2P4NU52_9EURY|nr:hypothetical protein [Haloferax marisrubri]POG56685.1 hypothetical protein AUR65_002330 [Haloferax marisrubri]